MNKLILLVLFFLFLPFTVVATYYGGDTILVYSIDQCHDLIIDVTATTPIESTSAGTREYAIHDCQLIHATSDHDTWSCSCSDGFDIVLNTLINTLNIYFFTITYSEAQTTTTTTTRLSSQAPHSQPEIEQSTANQTHLDPKPDNSNTSNSKGSFVQDDPSSSDHLSSQEVLEQQQISSQDLTAKSTHNSPLTGAVIGTTHTNISFLPLLFIILSLLLTFFIISKKIRSH